MEFHEDVYEKNPAEARKAWAGDGEFFFANTGDELLDKWEEEFAKGLIPDLEEGLSPSAREKLQKEREAARRKKGLPEPDMVMGGGDLTDAQRRQYASQFVSPGSRREHELLQRRARSQMLGSDPDPTAGSDWTDLLAGLK